ncbi:MAG: Hydrogenase maturation factor HybF [Mycoplasmataceae bacterium]|nr:MAG: Hydrogenase maturation factor HybF [Mycoplasmataceae bacterium]
MTNQTGTLCQSCCEKQILGQKTNSSSLTSYLDSNNSPPILTLNYQDRISAPPQQSQNQQTNTKCYNCKKSINQGDNSYYLPQASDKKWCEPCDPEVRVFLQATQEIFQGQKINIEQLNISIENKTELQVLAKLKNGEAVNIDQLNLDPASKAGLQEIQIQIEQGKIPTNKKPNQGYKYNSVCCDCHKEFSHMQLPNQCQACQSKKLKIYDAQGFLQQVITNIKSFYHNSGFWAGLVAIIVSVIFISYQTMRWKKAKRIGKKYSWWTDKIS